MSPRSISYVSRVYSVDQSSNIVKLDTGTLPNGKHLLSIVNSHNNERIFFADLVILVEGLSDRIFFEAILKHLIPDSGGVVYEVVSVGGKGLFPAYESVLKASAVPFVTVADLDYIEQRGTESLKGLFKINAKKIKEDVIEDSSSIDGKTLVDAIDVAISSGQWNDAQNIWDYIKSRRRSLPNDLTLEQKAELEQFLHEQRERGIYILGRGALEAYLPTGLRSKDMEKLITFVGTPDFWNQLPAAGYTELKEIAASIFGIQPPPSSVPQEGTQPDTNSTQQEVA